MKTRSVFTWLSQKKLKQIFILTRHIIIKKILLGYKKRGFGKGLYSFALFMDLIGDRLILDITASAEK